MINQLHIKYDPNTFIKKNIIHLDQGGGICYNLKKKKKNLVRENEWLLCTKDGYIGGLRNINIAHE